MIVVGVANVLISVLARLRVCVVGDRLTVCVAGVWCTAQPSVQPPVHCTVLTGGPTQAGGQ